MTTADGSNVSRETLEKLRAFARLIEKWNPKINLVSRGSLDELWERHIADSVQLTHLAPDTGHWVDLGSGGGLPGVVISILRPRQEITLVESDQRKAAFLRTAIRELELSATVIADRIEKIAPLSADVLSARALADLSTLLGFAEQHLSRSGTALFPKGETWRDEVEAANVIWSYICEPVKSSTNPAAAVLKIKEISRV